MDDLSLRQNILDELEFEPSIDAANIGVATDDGIVTLTGHVSSYSEKETAERVVRRVRGVRGIAEEIRVEVSGGAVTLKGKVHNWSERRAAERAAWSAPGIKTLNDQIAIA
ncbi:BON domain-containing protein [Rhizobium binxianense]